MVRSGHHGSRGKPNAVGAGLNSYCNSGQSVTAGIDLNPTYTLPGGHTAWIRVEGTLSTAYVGQITEFGFPKGIVAGAAYEFSAYVGSHRMIDTIIIMAFTDDFGNWTSYYASSWGGYGGEWASGAGNNGSVPLTTYVADGGLSTYKRIWTHGVAPAGTSRAYI